MDLPARFSELRAAAGMSKTQLARPRYTVSYVSQIEAGRRRPSPDALAFFAERLGVTPGFLSTGVPDGIEETLRYELEDARSAIRGRDAERAEAILPSVRVQAERFGLRRLHSEALATSGDARMLSGRIREAIDLYEEALQGELFERDAGMTAAALGRAYRGVGDLAYAGEVVESYLNRRRGAPLDPAVVAELHTVLASISFERGDMVRAERAAQRALAAAGEDIPAEVRAKTYWDASRVLAEAKRWDEALELATRARIIVEGLDDRHRTARLHNAQAFLCLEAEPPRMDEAGEHLDRAEAFFADSARPDDLAYVLSERSRLALMQDRPAEALCFAERALVSLSADETETARCLFLKGRALALLERDPDAEDALLEAAARFGKAGARQQQASCWREVGEMRVASGELASAVEAFRTGLEAIDPRRTRA